MSDTDRIARARARAASAGFVACDDDLIKGAGHKYLRRVPTGNPRHPWRYFYTVTGGHGLGAHEEFTEGAAFRAEHEGTVGHFHVDGIGEDGKLRVRHDETGQTVEMTRDELARILRRQHGNAISSTIDRAKAERQAAILHGTIRQQQAAHDRLEKVSRQFDQYWRTADMPRPQGRPKWSPKGYEQTARAELVAVAVSNLAGPLARHNWDERQKPVAIPADLRKAAAELRGLLVDHFGDLTDRETAKAASKRVDGIVGDDEASLGRLHAGLVSAEGGQCDAGALDVVMSQSARVSQYFETQRAKLDLAIDRKEDLRAEVAVFVDELRCEARRAYFERAQGTRTGLETVLDTVGQIRTSRGLDAARVLLRARGGPAMNDYRAGAAVLGYAFGSATKKAENAAAGLRAAGLSHVVTTGNRPVPELDAAIGQDVAYLQGIIAEAKQRGASAHDDVRFALEGTQASRAYGASVHFAEVRPELIGHRFSQIKPEDSKVKQLFMARFGVRIALEDNTFDAFVEEPEATEKVGYNRVRGGNIARMQPADQKAALARLEPADQERFKRWMRMDEHSFGRHAFDSPDWAGKAPKAAANEMRLAVQLSHEARADALRSVYNALADMETTTGGRIDMGGLPVVVADRFVGVGASAHYSGESWESAFAPGKLSAVEVHSQGDVKHKPHIALGMGVDKSLGHEIAHYLDNRLAMRVAKHERPMRMALAKWLEVNATLNEEGQQDMAGARAHDAANPPSTPTMLTHTEATILENARTQDPELGPLLSDWDANVVHNRGIGAHKYLSNYAAELVKRRDRPEWQTPKGRALWQAIRSSIEAVPMGPEMLALHEAVAETGAYRRFSERDKATRNGNGIESLLAEIGAVSKEIGERPYYSMGTEVVARCVEQYLYQRGAAAGRLNPTLTHTFYSGAPDSEGASAYFDAKTFDEKIAPHVKRLLAFMVPNMTKADMTRPTLLKADPAGAGARPEPAKAARSPDVPDPAPPPRAPRQIMPAAPPPASDPVARKIRNKASSGLRREGRRLAKGDEEPTICPKCAGDMSAMRSRPGESVHRCDDCAHEIRRPSGGGPDPLVKGGIIAGIRQEAAHLCGPASAQTVLAIYGIGAKQADLARAMGSTRADGTAPAAIVRGMRGAGLKARIVEHATPTQVRAWIRRGMFPILDIQAWGDKDPTNNDAGHYVVAVAENGDRIVLADPAAETPMTLTDDELVERWHDEEAGGQLTRRLAIVPLQPANPEPKPLHAAEAAPLAKSLHPAAAAVFRRDPHPVGPPPTRNRATFPYQGTADFQGLKIRIENPAGSVRRGTSPDGTPWETRMRVHYGEFVASEGSDGDPVDVFVGPAKFAPFAYVVHTQAPDTRRYDEDKVMLGFDTRADALAVFRAHYTGRGFVQAVRRLTIGKLRAWLSDSANRGRKINGGDTLAKACAFLSRVRSGET